MHIQTMNVIHYKSTTHAQVSSLLAQNGCLISDCSNKIVRLSVVSIVPK